MGKSIHSDSQEEMEMDKEQAFKDVSPESMAGAKKAQEAEGMKRPAKSENNDGAPVNPRGEESMPGK